MPAKASIEIAPHEEAAALIRSKPVVSKEVFDGLLPELKARAFVITGVEAFDVMQEARDLLATLPEGGDWEDIRRQLEEKISPWFSEIGAKRRAEMLLRTHGFQAYAAANYRSLEEAKDLFPFRQYLSSEDARVRPSHAALHLKIFPADSPFWATHTPPWEWGCRCDVVGLTEEEALQIREEDAAKPAEDRRFMEGLPLKSVEESNILHLGNGLQYNVSTPWEKGHGTGYQFEPGTLTMSMAALEARYDAQTWADWRAWAETTKVPTLGKTVWQWLNGKNQWKPKKQAELPPPIPPLPDADEIELLKLPGDATTLWLDPKTWPKETLKLPGNGTTIWLDPATWPKEFLQTLKFVRSLGGSTGAELHEAPDGTRYVVKKGASPEHLRTEVQADEIYQAAGVNVPKPRLIETPAGPVKVAQFIQGQMLGDFLNTAGGAERQAVLDQARQHFLVDALLGNWDVAGMSMDNMLVDGQGKVWRIDNGGSLDFRAQGAKKSGSEWKEAVDELVNMRSAKKNPSAAKLFAGVTDADLRGQLAGLQAQKAGILAAAGPHAAMLEKRLAWLETALAKPARKPRAKAAVAARPAPGGLGVTAAEVKKARVVGKAHVGDRDLIEDNNVLVWEAAGPGGAKVLRAKLRLTAKGSAEIMHRYGAAVPQAAAGPQMRPDDTHWAKLETAIKHVGAHASDKKYAQSKLALLDEVQAALLWLQPASADEAAMVAHYLDIIKKTKAHHAATTAPTPGEYKPYQTPPQAGQPVAGPLAVSAGSLGFTVGRRDRGFVEETSQTQHTIPAVRLADLSGGGVAEFVPWAAATGAASSVDYAFRGQMEIRIPGGATDANLAKLTQLLEHAGVPAERASADWNEYLYLHKNLELAAKSLPAAKKAAFRRITDGAGSDAEKAAKLKALARDAGWDVDGPHYQPEGRAGNSFGQGWQKWERFDLPRPVIEREMKDYALTHESSMATPDLIDSILNGGGQVTNTTERLRQGVSLASTGGMSSNADMRTGGANYFFTRIAPESRHQRHRGMVFKIGNLARLDAISFDGDKYGDVRPAGENSHRSDPRKHRGATIEDFKRNAQTGNNETIFKHGLSLLDDIDVIRCSSATERQAVLDIFRKHKITQLPDGRDIEAVVTA